MSNYESYRNRAMSNESYIYRNRAMSNYESYRNRAMSNSKPQHSCNINVISVKIDMLHEC